MAETSVALRLNTIMHTIMIQKKWALGLLMTAGLCACSSGQQKSTTTQDSTITSSETPISVAPDQHGCNAAAGETWSQLRQSCLQIFEEGERLDPVQPAEGQAVISAFVLFSADSTQIELFLPTDEPSTLLRKDADGLYRADAYQYDAARKLLTIQGVSAYQGSAERK